MQKGDGKGGDWTTKFRKPIWFTYSILQLGLGVANVHRHRVKTSKATEFDFNPNAYVPIVYKHRTGEECRQYAAVNLITEEVMRFYPKWLNELEKWDEHYKSLEQAEFVDEHGKKRVAYGDYMVK